MNNIIFLDSFNILAFLKVVMKNENIYVISSSVPGIEKIISNFSIKTPGLIEFNINSTLKTMFVIYKLQTNFAVIPYMLRIILFNTINKYFLSKGKHIELYQDDVSFKVKVKKIICLLKPKLTISTPSNELKTFVLSKNIKYLPDFKFPQYLHIALTKRCNLKCIMCPYHSDSLEDKHYYNDYFSHNEIISEHLLRKIVDEASEHNVNILFGQYDEPLLYKNFVDCVVYAINKGCAVSITTNGTLVTEEVAERLIDAGVKHISFSLDAASEESYRKIRKGEFVVPIENLKRLVEIKARNKSNTVLRACMVLQKDNQHEQNDFKILMQDIGVDVISYYNLSVFKNGIWQNEVINSYDDVNNIQRTACSQLWSQAMIYPDGGLSFCCASTMYVRYYNDIPYMGNLNKSTISDIWGSKRYEKIRTEALNNIFTDNRICKFCNIWYNFAGKTTTDSNGNEIYTNPYERFICFKR